MKNLEDKDLIKSFYDRIKRNVIGLIKEKYNRSNLDKSAFIGDLYVHLTKELNQCLSDKFPNSDRISSPPESTEELSTVEANLLNKYMELAQDSELADEKESANNFYLNRITYLPEHPGLWYEYGVYLLRYIKNIYLIEKVILIELVNVLEDHYNLMVKI